MADKKEPVVGKIEQLSQGKSNIIPFALQPKPQKTEELRALSDVKLDAAQFTALQHTLVIGAIITGYLASGRSLLSPAKLAEVKATIALVAEELL